MTEGIRKGRPSMRGTPRPRPQTGLAPELPRPSGPVVFHNPLPAVPQQGLKKVLFVCIGNSCRSQMAEGFARAYGKDVLEVRSAGLSPASIVQDETHDIMHEFGVRLEGQYPKGIEMMMREEFDIVVNISGEMLPRMKAERVLEWKIRDPIGQSESVYQKVATEIEARVKALIDQLRG